MPDTTGRQPPGDVPVIVQSVLTEDGLTRLGSANRRGGHIPGADRVIVETNTRTGAVVKVDAAPHAPNTIGDTGKPDAIGSELEDPGTAVGAAIQHRAAAAATSDPDAKIVESLPLAHIAVEAPRPARPAGRPSPDGRSRPA